MKQRDTSLDIIRVLACFLVVLMHSPIPGPNANGAILTPLSYITAPCIGLFFMVSGALLLPVKTDYFTFIRKRFSKIVIPTVIWSLIYIALNLYNSESEINLWESLISIPFTPQGEGVLWFMYTLSGLYLLAPILSAWIDKATRQELQLVLALWMVTLCYPLLNFWVVTNSSTTGILYYFTGYAGYFLLGYYLKKYPDSISACMAWIVAGIGMVLLFGLKRYQIPFDFYQLFWYESIFIVALAVAMWKSVMAINHRIECRSNTLTTISNLSFGIYLIHILIMRYWLWHSSWILGIGNYAVQILVVASLTFLLSTLSCWLISYLPFSQWIIAYRSRN